MPGLASSMEQAEDGLSTMGTLGLPDARAWLIEPKRPVYASGDDVQTGYGNSVSRLPSANE
ncbi:hypothetical protein FHT77_005726 [Rhizobium sp. BK181]|nr:hypothetical protein [Rhizobium sp. BK181]